MAHGKSGKTPEQRGYVPSPVYTAGPDSGLSPVFMNGRVPTADEMREYYKTFDKRTGVTNYGTVFANEMDAEAWRVLLKKGNGG